ncbi:hypothetical protein AGMMS49990_06230 [Endomicrobiia bacterium]|nr:hypothetical protein AGMMS49990_06230 [Endomicrobiia bacterium]
MSLKALLCKRWELVECKEIREHIRNELNNLQQKYDFIFSIGASCHCAMTLIAHFLRRASGPFDWVNYYDGKKKHFDNFEGNIELILNRFKNFMNIEDFEEISDGGGGT